MANNNQIASEVLARIGGKDNVTNVTHCMTRLRFNLKDESLADQEEIKKISGVLGVVRSGGQLQIIIGQTVDKVYEEICKLGGFKMNDALQENLDTKKRKWTLSAIGGAVLDGLAGSLTPAIPALMVAAFFKLILAVLGPDMIGLISAKSDIYTLLNFVGNTPFYFLPVIIGYSSAKKFGANPFLGMVLGGILINPVFVGMVTAKTAFTVFGIPCSVQDYSSSVLPIILSTWVMSYVERFLKKLLPTTLKTVFVPGLTILIMLPLSLCALGPAGALIGNYICKGLLSFSDLGGIASILAIAVIAAVYEFLVMSGMHLVLISTLILVFSQEGREALIIPSACAASLAVAGMCLGAILRLKNKEERSLAVGYFIASLVGGVTEPGLYGVGIKYKRTFIGLMVGGFAGGLYAGITHVTAYALVPVASVLCTTGFIGGPVVNFINGLIACLIAFVVSTVVTYFTGFRKDDPVTLKK